MPNVINIFSNCINKINNYEFEKSAKVWSRVFMGLGATLITFVPFLWLVPPLSDSENSKKIFDSLIILIVAVPLLYCARALDRASRNNPEGQPLLPEHQNVNQVNPNNLFLPLNGA